MSSVTVGFVLVQVCIADINEERGAATCQTLLSSHPGCVSFVQCDITKEEQIEGKT